MRVPSVRRLSLLGAATVTLLGLMAGPAAAAGWEITDGTITIDAPFGSDIVFDLANPEPDDCSEEPPPATIDVDFDTPSSGDVAVDFGSVGHTTAFGTTYEATITGSGTGSYTGSSPFAVDLLMDFVVEFTEIEPPECVPGEVVCVWELNDVALDGTYTGTIPESTGSTVVLDTTTAAEIEAQGGCPFLLAIFDGRDVTVDDLTAVFS